MKVAFGTTVLAKGLAHGGVDGIGSYTRELGMLLVRGQVAEIFPVGFGVSIDASFFDAKMAKCFPRYPLLAVPGALLPCSFPGTELHDHGVDLFHATDHLIPKFSHIPVVATLMDAIPFSHPEWVRMDLAPFKRWLWRRAARWADHVITISEYSKTEIIKHFGVKPENISVTPLGVDARFFERIDEKQKAEVLKNHGLPETFFIFVGTLQPRKNIERAIQAHAALPDRIRKSIPLVIVGRAGWGCDNLVADLRDPKKQISIRWLQYLPDFEVRALMQSASALIFPSLCEGFGLPVVEAFASGLPVITSNTTSLPEVAEDAALLVNPENIGEISDAMRQIVDVADLSAQLIDAGLRRAKQLSWESCTQKTLDIYKTVIGG